MRGTARQPVLDFGSAKFLDDPYPSYRRARERGPVLRDDRGMWLITDYATCEEVLRDKRWGHADRDPRLASAVQAPAMRIRVFPDLDSDPWPFMRQNPPDHTRVRTLVNKSFTPRIIAGFESTVADMAGALVDRIVAAGEADLVRDFAEALPIRSISARLGVPERDRNRLRDASMEYARGFDPGFAADDGQLAACERAAGVLRDYFAELIAARRAQPREDLLSELVAARAGGDFLSDEELIVTAALLLSAGNETSVSLLGNGALTLLRHPGALAWFREHQQATAIEELLRYESPFQFGDRVALTDLSLRDMDIRAGDRALLLVGSANRDPAAFADPDTLDLTRDPNRHLSFGAGIHFCVGAPLARLQGRVALRTLFERAPGLRLAGPPVRAGVAWNRGLASVPVVVG